MVPDICTVEVEGASDIALYVKGKLFKSVCLPEVGAEYVELLQVEAKRLAQILEVPLYEILLPRLDADLGLLPAESLEECCAWNDIVIGRDQLPLNSIPSFVAELETTGDFYLCPLKS